MELSHGSRVYGIDSRDCGTGSSGAEQEVPAIAGDGVFPFDDWGYFAYNPLGGAGFPHFIT